MARDDQPITPDGQPEIATEQGLVPTDERQVAPVTLADLATLARPFFDQWVQSENDKHKREIEAENAKNEREIGLERERLQRGAEVATLEINRSSRQNLVLIILLGIVGFVILGGALFLVASGKDAAGQEFIKLTVTFLGGLGFGYGIRKIRGDE